MSIELQLTRLLMGQLFKIHEKKKIIIIIIWERDKERPTSDCAKNMPMISGIIGIN